MMFLLLVDVPFCVLCESLDEKMVSQWSGQKSDNVIRRVWDYDSSVVCSLANRYNVLPMCTLLLGCILSNRRFSYWEGCQGDCAVTLGTQPLISRHTVCVEVDVCMLGSSSQGIQSSEILLYLKNSLLTTNEEPTHIVTELYMCVMTMQDMYSINILSGPLW